MESERTNEQEKERQELEEAIELCRLFRETVSELDESLTSSKSQHLEDYDAMITQYTSKLQENGGKGENPHKMARNPATVLIGAGAAILLIIVSLVLLSSPKSDITGYAVGLSGIGDGNGPVKYTFLDIPIDSDKTYGLGIGRRLSHVSAEGYLSKESDVSVFLEDKNRRYLILDSQAVRDKAQSRRGFVIVDSLDTVDFDDMCIESCNMSSEPPYRIVFSVKKGEVKITRLEMT